MKRLNTNPHIIKKEYKQNQFFPNNKLPLLIYKGALQLPGQKNTACAIVQKIFLKNNWGNTWRNGVYDFHHYHSNAHECLGICAGEAKLIFGGPGKRNIIVERGDVVIIPAGVAHKCVDASKDFLCVGAYPEAKDYDINHGRKEEYNKALGRIKKLPLPKEDPVFGSEGFLKSYWKKEE